MIGGLDDIHLMLDHQHGIALVDQPIEDAQEHVAVLEMEAGGGFIEDIDGAPGADFAQFGGELDALGLAAGEGGSGLAEADVTQADILQGLELAPDRREIIEKLEGVIHRHVEDAGDRLPLVFDLEGLAVVALALADLAGDVYIRQKMHLDLQDTVALAGLTAAALDVKTEASGLVAADLGLRQLGEEIPDGCEEAGVGGGVGARGAADRRLVDGDHLVEMLQPLDGGVGQRGLLGAVEMLVEEMVEGLVDKGALAAARNPGDTDEGAEGDFDIDLFKIIAARPFKKQMLAASRPPFFRHGDDAPTGQIVPGDGGWIGRHLRRRSHGHHLAAVLAGAGAEIDDEIGFLNGLLVMLDHHHRIAEVPQPHQGVDEALVVALMQADRGLIEDIEHPHQLRADLGGQADALGLSSRQAPRSAVEGEIVKPDIVEKGEPLADLLEDLLGDLLVAGV
ncbi:MAG: hypothetical protein BWY77_00252 [bacterium ADurb.Bin431]|nr:MAG: hypothetical protein BWY77_00252 [bacterium ADurb.Bin431]